MPTAVQVHQQRYSQHFFDHNANLSNHHMHYVQTSY